jgi:excisionase family DNA binding protein
MSQLALLPLDTIETNARADQGESARLVRVTGRARQSPRTAVGAPGFLSVRAAAERLGLQARSVRYLIEHGRLGSQRLGRMHFIPSGQVESYRRVRRARARRSQRSLA